ncbi:AIPR family protein [Chelatococcus asaccharovorans]|uniref:AIPR protein n=1 Tax=Chelatococcus asaccharovorans TaxID=28210 RepID=A0A2V3UBM7_9HYPH|nr:AIPR family protein [Chelatococcus asaccharovorans]MBS7703179.1 AIPR family protein [Chelatococcus asaccharovorans]PXW61508.1 AIPR protein [Chelatococcus asaccharovorans]
MVEAGSLDEILESLDELSTRGGIPRGRAFAAWYAINFYNLDEDDALEAAAADGGNDQGIDLAFADATTEKIIVIQAHCPENTTKKCPKAKWDAVLSSVPFVIDPSNLGKNGRPDLEETISSLKESNPDFQIMICLITLGKNSDEIRGSVVAHSKRQKDIEFLFVPQEDIISRYKALVLAGQGVPEDTLEFCGGIIEDKGEYGRAWIGSVSATELQRLHGKHGSDLFAGNVRLFLGARKGGINEQIINTATDSPGIFWALNNGVTIVADTATAKKPSGKINILSLKRFSIVNGCQTTTSLVQAQAAAEAKVLVRVIAAKNSIKTDIVRYNNSQNAIKIWTVRSADHVQQVLRGEFKKINVDYAPKQEGSRRKKGDKIIELDKVAQYIASSETEFLIQAIDNKSELFDRPYQKIFPAGIRASTVYLAWIIGGKADSERQSLLKKLNKDHNTNLLSVTSSYWIIFCTYKLIAKFSNLESVHIDLNTMNTTEFIAAITKYVSKATDLFYDAALDTYDRDEYGSFKATLRSQKFLQKMDGKLNARVARLPPKSLPDLVNVSKGAKANAKAAAKMASRELPKCDVRSA